MEKLIGMILIICVALTCSGKPYAALVSKETDMKTVQKAAAVTQAEEEKITSEAPLPREQIVKMKELVAEKKKELEDASWKITIVPAGDKTKTGIDTIVFSGGKVVSKKLETLGYGATNFTLRPQEDGAMTWESVQTSESDGTVFWIGDIRDGAMSGKMSKRDKKGNAIDYSFAGSKE